MNFNVILAIFENKGIITEDEAIAIAEYLAQSPQSTHYVDAQRDIAKLLEKE
jgi:hypothetical protein